MKIYTKTGDKGETGLNGGKRVGKDDARIRAYGEIDELNALLGVCRARNQHAELENILHTLQRELFDLGADLATPLESKVVVPRVSQQQIQQLEKWIDEIDAQLPVLKNFILPGGSLLAAELHVVRTACRRAERTIVALAKIEKVDELVVVFVNRLSDLLFMMARLANKLDGVEEEKWKG